MPEPSLRLLPFDRIVRGSTIDVCSEPGEGTTFTLWLSAHGSR